MRSFNPLVYRIASERFRTAQLDKGVKVVELEKARTNPELAGHFLELVQAGQLGLLEAVGRYNGQWRFATYAREWIFKRTQEYVRSNWHVVLMPEPSEWKVAKEDKIPPTVPNPQLNPLDNPLSPSKKAKHGRAAELPEQDVEEDSEHVDGPFKDLAIRGAKRGCFAIGAIKQRSCTRRRHEI